MGKIVITKQNDRLLLALFDEKKPYLMETAPFPGEEGILGNIYLAKVRDIVPGINGAFLSISSDETVFLPLAGCREILAANREPVKGQGIRQGDEVVVQIVQDALKTKHPTASEKLALTGQYCVCSYFGHGIRYSRKLDEGKKKRIGDGIRLSDTGGRRRYQFTIRTNAESLNDLEPLLEEMRTFANVFDCLYNTYRHRTCYTCFYCKEPEIISQIKDISMTAYDEIVTDERKLYELLEGVFPDKNIRFYQDELLSLSGLYSIGTHLQEALGKRVWLPCGGYLVIEPTEAMVVIDVNSGKAVSKADGRGKNGRGYYLKVNLEAAKEVARQLRIRNYSGMIMVDFINMESDEDNRELLDRLDAYLKEDKTKTRLVDMTALGIVEITRKKGSRPLADFFLK